MNKLLKKIIWLIIAVPLVYLAVIWNKLPQTVAVHFTINGIPDRFGHKNEVLVMTLILTALSCGTYLLLTNVYRLDPKKYSPENKKRLDRIAFVISLFMAFVLCLIVYSTLHGTMKSGVRFIFIGIGLLFCFIGNYMHSIKPNYFAGIRLPWTLENEDNWRKTHLLAGKLFFAGGLLIAIACLFTPDKASVFVVLVITFAIIFICAAYSYRLHKQQKTLSN